MSFNNTRTFRKPVGIKPRYPVAMRPGKNNAMTLYLEGETLRMFRKLWPIHSNRRIAEWFGLSFSTIQRFAKEQGLKKNMTAIHKEHARDIKKTCEANGYYDSIRGRRPSEACMEASRRRWEEWRATGNHSFKILKERNPRKYAEVMKKRGSHIHELREQEKTRLRWGFEQKTKLRVTLHQASPRAASQKHLMIKECNYFADPDHSSWVLYDNETRRSARREATARKHGLKVFPSDDYVEPTNNDKQ